MTWIIGGIAGIAAAFWLWLWWKRAARLADDLEERWR